MPLNGYYTAREAAEYLDTSYGNIMKLIHMKRVLKPDHRVNGRLMLFSQATLDAFNASWRWQRRAKTSLQTRARADENAMARLDTSDEA